MEFSPVIVGAMRLGKWGASYSLEQYERFIDECVGMGLYDFDHADIYGDYTTEEEFGRIIKKRPDLKNKLKITTKCGIKLDSDPVLNNSVKSYDLSPEYIFSAVDRSLSNLGLDKLDLLLLHRPDFLMDQKAIADCFSELKAQGKVVEFGVSNFSNTQLQTLAGKYPLSMHQIEISLQNYEAFENGALDVCVQENITVSAWSPLGGGALLKEDPKNEVLSTAKDLASKYDCTASQILMAWLNSHPVGIIPVIGTSKIERVREAMESQRIVLEKEDWYALLQSRRSHEVA